jgi:hypothetical protein
MSTITESPATESPATESPAVEPVVAEPAVAASTPAPAPAARKGRKEIPALVSAEEYLEMLENKVTSNIITPDQLGKLHTPSYQRDQMPAQVKRIREALKRGEYVPSIILSHRNENGKDAYRLVDGLQRASAAKSIGYPLAATIIDFDTTEEEREHFIAFQRSLRVNPNLICKIHSNEPANRAVIDISEDATHPLVGRIWFGSGKRGPAQLTATCLTSAVKKGVEVDDLAEFGLVLATLFTLGTTSTICKSGGIRGAIQLFYFLRDEADFDVNNPIHQAIFTDFDWSAVEESAKVNSPSAGKLVGDALISYWNANSTTSVDL